jgi:hypothetical protein
MLKYSELTKEEKKKICNGCGSKGGWIKPPEFLFHASCDQHDFYYWRGGLEPDRKKADDEFYRYMIIDCSRADGLVKYIKYRLIAFIYYQAVRYAGKMWFNYGEMKTKKDLK